MSESLYNFTLPIIGTFSLTTSNIIDILGILAALIPSLVAIAISLKTLKQNSQMIEDSSRPYLMIYSACTHIVSPSCYLILKNFGQSAAYVDSFTYDFDLGKCTVSGSRGEPFQNIDGTCIAPGQSFRAIIDYNKVISQTDKINFHISYSSNCKKYTEDICLNLLANSGNFETHNTTEGKELSNISEAIQQINIRHL